MTEADGPTLDSIDSSAYPYPVADWRDIDAYPDHKGNATMYAWELTRRDRRFQLLSDVQRLSYARETEGPETIHAVGRLVAAALSLPEMEELVHRSAVLTAPYRERRYGLFAREIEAEELLRHAVWLALGEWFAPFHKAAEGAYREGLPPADRPVFDRERTPPWPIHWPGKDVETRGAGALLDLVDYPAGLPRELFMEDLNENERAVVEGRTIGSLEVHSQANAYSSTYWSNNAPSPKGGDEVWMVFHLSANAGAQSERARAMLEGMQRRARFEEPERAMPMPRTETARRILRYLDWHAEGDCDRRGAAAEFKKAIGVPSSGSKTWRQLLEQVRKYTADPVALTRLR